MDIEMVAFAIMIRRLLAAPVTAFLPGMQIWFMLLARHLDWWPEPGIMWFDWIMAMILPGYALYQAAFE